MTSILHVANFGHANYGLVPYSVDRKIHNGLIRNGCCVQEFSYRDVARYEGPFRSKKLGTKLANQRLIEAVENFEPELVLLGHSEIITPETLRRIKSTNSRLTLSMWYVDWVLDPIKAEMLSRRLDIIDHLFITSAGGALDPFRKYGARIHYLPNPVDESVERFRNDEKSSLEIDFLFCGRDEGEPERAANLKAIATGLQNMNARFFGCLGNQVVLGAEFLRTLAGSKMGLNFSRTNQLPYYSSDRIAQLTGNGILTFSHRVPHLDKIFSAQEVVYFDSIDELLEQAHHYHQNDDQRRAIARRGRERAHQDYNSTRVARYMLDVSLAQAGSDYALSNYAWSDY